jgi:hypothetical protein
MCVKYFLDLTPKSITIVQKNKNKTNNRNIKIKNRVELIDSLNIALNNFSNGDNVKLNGHGRKQNEKKPYRGCY